MTQQIRRVGQHAALSAIVRQELLADWLEERLGKHRFDVDLARRELVFSSDRGRIAARAELIASIAVEPATLLWGWAPVLADRVGDDGAAHRVRAFGEQHVLPELTADEVPYLVPDGADQTDRIADVGHDAGHAAIEALGHERHYYTFPTGSAGSRVVLVLDQWRIDDEPGAAPPQPGFTDVFVRLPRLLQGVDDIGWSLDGLARLLPGWRCERLADAGPGKPAWRLTDADGAAIDIATEFDQHNRLVQLNVKNTPAAGHDRPGTEPAAPEPQR